MDDVRSPFIDAVGKPRLLHSAALFFDFLGVSAMAQGSEEKALEELIRFDKTVRAALPYPIGTAALEQGSSAYPAAVFSDSVVAAIPTGEDLSPGVAVLQLIFEVGRFQTELALLNYFGRGAITLDLFHFHDGLIFGPALVEGVGLESGAAINPRVILSAAATEAVLTTVNDSDGFEPPILVDEDRLAFVDYLGATFTIDPEPELAEVLAKHRDAVMLQLDASKTNLRRWSKHRWVAEYHNATVERYETELKASGGFEQFLVPSVRTKRAFERLR